MQLGILAIEYLKSNLIRHIPADSRVMIPQEIKTVKTVPETRLKEKGSVFIANGFNVNTAEEVTSSLKLIKRKYFDASHHCYAHRLADGTFKYSDDGEPSGTAGLRILNAIDHFGLTNLVLIVTRYFGGTKLGTGPLGKAYYNSAESSLNISGIITLVPFIKVHITSQFDQMNHIYRLLNEIDSKIMNTTYQEDVMLDCLIKPSEMELFVEKVKEATNGIAKIMIDRDYYLI